VPCAAVASAPVDLDRQEQQGALGLLEEHLRDQPELADEAGEEVCGAQARATPEQAVEDLKARRGEADVSLRARPLSQAGEGAGPLEGEVEAAQVIDEAVGEGLMAATGRRRPAETTCKKRS
jgi:hypothetical protein